MIQWIPTGVIQVTGWAGAASLKTLMDAASAWKGTAALALNPNYVLLNPEWTVRVTLDGSTPTASTGLELSDLWHYYFETSLDKLIIIDAIAINIMVGNHTPW